MSQAPFLYFLTGKAGLPAYVADATPGATRQPAQGPAGTESGKLCSPCAQVLTLDYEPDHQRWVKLEESEDGAVWLGIDGRFPVKPEQVARRVQRPGHLVKLGDGNTWEIPVARLALGGSGLPRRRVLDDKGRLVWEVEAAYAGLSAGAARLWNLRQGLAEGLLEEELDQIVGEALSVNYRLHHREAAALGLLTDDSIRGVVDALLDWPTVLQLVNAQKKSQSDT